MSFDKQKIKELYPGVEDMLIQPMLIHKATNDQLKKADNSGEWFAQLKKDGALYMFYKGNEGQTYLFGRTVSKKTGILTEKSANVPHIIEVLNRVPNGTIILGEIYYPGKTSKDVTSIMGCLPEKAIERQESSYGLIHYYIYDCLMYNGISLLDYYNYIRYIATEALFEKNGFADFDYLELAKAETEDLYQKTAAALAAGEEGMVFKKKDGLYEPGKRPMTNLKAKQVDYIDAFIIGFNDPVMEYTGKELETWDFNIQKDGTRLQGKYAWLKENGYNPIPVTKHYYYGWKNAIRLGAWNNKGEIEDIGTIASGLTDELRKDFAENPDKYFNRVVSIQCMSKDNKEHTLRHGFFVKFHDEKECTRRKEA